MKKLPSWALVAIVTLLLVLGSTYLSTRTAVQSPVAEIPYSAFKKLVRDGEVAGVVLRGDRAGGTLKRSLPLGRNKAAITRFRTRVPAWGDPGLLPALGKAKVEVRVEPAEGGGAESVLLSLLPWIVIFGLYWWFWRRMQGGGMGGFGGRAGADKFLEGSARAEDKDARRYTFDDIAGQDNAKHEVAELVDYLREPSRYTRLGAEVPHGVLLMGPPGTGKTLLARALAGEAQVPFYHTSASEFIELYVGVGASRVRRMFDEAKKRAPSIIFIDEIDSVGRVRGAGLGGGHDEREQTLNQILAEMDGFAGHEAVIVLAATNRPDVLDPALLRPGRFDRHVTLDLPDTKAREAILRVHTRKTPLGDDVDLAIIAAGTPGFSGADIKNLVNEAAMRAARAGSETVSAADFDDVRDKILMGSVRTLAIQPEERHRLAVHESGHTVLAHYLPTADPLHKVSIIPRGRALGVTQQLPEEERHTLPEDYLRDRLAIMMAGRTAESVLLETISSGADDDIHQATKLARAMVGRWGMAEDVGPVDVRESESHPFLGREMAQPRHFSEATAQAVDKAVRRFLLDAEHRAAAVIRAHRVEIDRLVAALEAEETLDHDQIVAILGPAIAAENAPKKTRSA